MLFKLAFFAGSPTRAWRVARLGGCG